MDYNYFYSYKGLNFDRTCSLCPEQYDVYNIEGVRVGYVRVRWGEVHFWNPDYTELYYHEVFSDDLTGCFASDYESKKYLRKFTNIYNKQLKEVK